MDYRSISFLGGSAAVTLPRAWIESHRIKKGDPVKVTEQEDGSLRVEAVGKT